MRTSLITAYYTRLAENRHSRPNSVENRPAEHREKGMIGKTFARATLNLTHLQITAVIAVFFVTSIGAVGLAYLFRKWNG